MPHIPLYLAFAVPPLAAGLEAFRRAKHRTDFAKTLSNMPDYLIRDIGLDPHQQEGSNLLMTDIRHIRLSYE
jgi:hypothetical protein